jgi:hypothetical protein
MGSRFDLMACRLKLRLKKIKDMKTGKNLITLIALAFSLNMYAQNTEVEVTKKNSWLKAGLTAGIPVGDLHDASSFALGLDLKGQLMTTNHVGIGLTTGYNHFFMKEGFESFGTVPLGAFIRVYPDFKGFFAGVDGGVSFTTGTDNNSAGPYIRPQLGYHNYDWNLFAFYNNDFRKDEDGGNLQYAGIGFTYNIRFK